MSVSYSDCFSDLLCREDSGSLLGDQLPECSSSDVESPADAEESIAGFIEGERNFVPGIDYVERFQSQPLDASARQESVAWILKVIIIKTPRFRSDCILYVSSLTNYLRARRDRITSFVLVFIQLANVNVKTALVSTEIPDMDARWRILWYRVRVCVL